MTILKELLLEWRERNQVTTEVVGYQEAVHDIYAGELAILAERAGVSVRRLSDIMRGYRTDGVKDRKGYAVTFPTADALVTAMDMQHEWYLRLKEYYGPLPVGKWEKDRKPE